MNNKVTVHEAGRTTILIKHDSNQVNIACHLSSNNERKQKLLNALESLFNALQDMRYKEAQAILVVARDTLDAFNRNMPAF